MILGVFGLILDAGVARGLAGDVDRALTRYAESVGRTIVAYRQAEQAVAGAPRGNWQSAPVGTFRGAVERGQLPDLLRRWARKTDALTQEYPVRVLSRSGQPLVASPAFHTLGIAVTPSVIEQTARRRAVYETFRRPGPRLRVVTWPAVEQGRVLFVIQVAASLSAVEASVRQFHLLLVVLIPVTLSLASSVGWFLATVALRPVDAIITHVQDISTQRLEARVPVPDTGDEVERLAVTCNRVLERMERGFRQLRRFSAAASHELRTPLTVMRGELDVTLRQPRAPAEYERVLREQRSVVDEMAATVEELLTLSYSEAVDRTVEWSPLDVAAVVAQASDPWRKVARGRSVRVTVEAAAPVWIRGERRLLERLLANLLENAIKHTPDGGLVTIRVDQQDTRARLQVQDTGPGIPPEQLPQLYDRFFTSRGPAAEPSSTGVGLGLCRWIAEVHRGQIDVASPPGQGALFTVSFPLATPTA